VDQGQLSAISSGHFSFFLGSHRRACQVFELPALRLLSHRDRLNDVRRLQRQPQ
jgi:hypothetical protein